MTLSFLTGSETLRDAEILQHWLVFEPISDERFATSGGIYSVPLGQTVPADFLLRTGSAESVYDTGYYYFNIEKIKYIFEVQEDANKFINDIGMENIVSYYEQTRFNVDTRINELIYIIEIINFPKISIETNPINFEPKKGYRIEVLEELQAAPTDAKLGSNQIVEHMGRDFINDSHHGIITEPFLLYFDLEAEDAK